MKLQNLHKYIALTVVLSASITLSGCSPKDLMFWESQVVDDEAARENPLFWDIATQVSGTTNLYTVAPDFFENKPYTDILRFGDNILLVGQAVYSDSPGTPSDEFEDGEENYEFSFDVYSPWRNAFVNSIDHNENDCVSYTVLSDGRLILYDSNSKISIYDESLKLIGKYKCDNENAFLTGSLYAGSSEHELIFGEYETGSLFKFELPEFDDDTTEYLTMKSSPLSLDLANASIIDTEANGKNLILNGIDPVTLRKENCLYNVENGSLTILNEFKNCYTFKYSSDSYIATWDEGAQIHKLHSSDGNDYYWHDENINKFFMLSDDSFAIQHSIYAEEDSSYTMSAELFKPDGTIRSGFSCKFNDGTTSSYVYPASGAAYFEEDELVFYLVSGTDSSPYLMAWKTDDKGQYGTDLSFTQDYDLLRNQIALEQYNDEDGNTPYTMIPDSKSYDWNDLADCRRLANSLEDKYQIKIYLGEEVPTDMGSYSISTCLDSDTLKEALYKFDDILSLYPEGFFEQLKYGEISTLYFYFGGTISGKGGNTVTEAAAFVTHNTDSTLMVLNSEDLYGWLNTIHHELSHIIDQRLFYKSTWLSSECKFSEEGWASLNPSDFVYSEDYATYYDYKPYDKYSDYFISSYSSTYPTEDRAEIFSKACEYADGDLYVKDVFFNKKVMAKMKYYCECIRDGFDTTGWPDELPWEKICN